MTVAYQILLPQNLVYVRVAGKINLQDISESLRNYVNDDDFRPHQRQIVDLCNMKDAFTAFWEMREYKKLYDELYEGLPNPIPVAIVTNSPFGKRLAWMYSRVMMDRQTLDLSIFPNIGGALSEFEVPDSAFFGQLYQKSGESVVNIREFQASRAYGTNHVPLRN